MGISINDVLADPEKKKSLGSRFWDKVDRRDENECWPWIAKASHVFGYGVINSGRGNTYCSHVVSFAIHNGYVSDKKWVLHSCDNPKCCNPKHLRMGTREENANDARERGRLKGRTGPKDRSMCAKKLTAPLAIEIFNSGLSRTEASVKYRISKHSVSNILSGRTWSRSTGAKYEPQSILRIREAPVQDAKPGSGVRHQRNP